MHPSAQAKLILHYKEKEWLGIIDKPNADEIVTFALGRIKQDPNQYDVFLGMLRKIEGMDLIVKQIISGESDQYSN